METSHTLSPKNQSWYLSGQVSESDGVRRIDIPALPCEVGRRGDAPVALPCASVSKNHACLFEVDGQLCIRDLGSTNGTFVNGNRLSGSGHVVLSEGDLIQFATIVFRLGSGRAATEGCTLHEESCDRALAMMQFDRLLNDGGAVPFFQPIVDLHQNCRTIGYEVLGRSRLFGLKTPAEMFSAAAKLNLEAELSRAMRVYGVQLASQFPAGLNIFLNTHPIELTTPDLKRSLTSLRELAPDLAMTLEIHEAAITNTELIESLRDLLNALEMQLAFDDFGVGRARLVELSEVRPDFVKFDMKLTRDIHRATPKRQEVVSLIAKMVNDLGIKSLAEGVENEESHEILKDMNFHLAQGFHYGRPAPVGAYVGIRAASTGAPSIDAEKIIATSDTDPPGR